MPRLKHNDPIRAISQHITPVDQSDKVQSRTQRATRTVDSEYRGVQIPQPQPQTTSSALQQQLQRMQEVLANVEEQLHATYEPLMTMSTSPVQRTAATRARRPKPANVATIAMPPTSRTVHVQGNRPRPPRSKDDTTAGPMQLTRPPVQRTVATAAAMSTRPQAQKTVATAAAMSTRHPGQRTATRHPGQRTATRHPGQRTPALYKPSRTSDKYQIVDARDILSDGKIFNKFSLDNPTDINFITVIDRG